MSANSPALVDQVIQLINGLPLVVQIALIPLAIVAGNVCWQLLPKDPNTPPVVFHWFPFIGSAVGYGTDPLNFFYKNREKYGNVFTFILFGRRVTVALGPQGNNFVLGGKSTVFNAEDAYTHFTTPVFGTGVVYDVPNEIFMEQKRFAKVAFSTEAFRAYVGEIEAEIEDFMATDPAFAAYRSPSREWGKFDVLKTLQELIILTAARSLQGTDVRKRMDKTFADMYIDLDGGFTPLNFMFPNLPLPSYRRRDIAHKKMSDFYTEIIQQRRAAGTYDQEHDVMASFMTQHYKNGKPFGDKEVAHMMIALLMAGQHTSSATTSWSLLEIAARPDVLQELYEEQVKHFSAPDGSLRSMTYDELRSLPVLDSVIRETLRCHPPIHSIMRKVRDHAPVPTTLAAPRNKSGDGVYVVPKGNYVLATPYASQMDPNIWKNADKWEPSRWSDPEGVAADALRKYVDEGGEKVDFGFGAVSKGTDSPYQPFGAGRHRCIGEQFAYLQIGVIIATLIRKLELKLENPVPDINFHTMIVLPKDPKVISYRRRA